MKPDITSKPDNTSARYKKSNDMLERAERVIPLGSQTFSKSRLQYPVPFAPLYLERGRGSRVWDVDGNEYVDLICGLLPITLGYCDPDVDAAIKDQLARGIAFSMATELEVQLAEQLVRLIPCAGKVRFGKNGTDATSAAVRLARAYTGRDYIIACGYHGWQDWYIGATTRSLGVPERVQGLTRKLPYNNPDAIEECVKELKGQVAAIILEPVSAKPPHEGYLEFLRELTEQKGIVLIFDEVVTGFHVHMGGAQAHYGVTPDLAAFGKGMGNGMPISAVVGRADIMDLMERIFYSGTFGGETLSLVASLAVIHKMERENVIDKLWETGQQLAGIVERAANENGLDECIRMSGLAPWKILDFHDVPSASKEALKTRFMIEMLREGVLVAASHNVCYAHNEEDIRKIESAYGVAFSRIAEDLADERLEQRLEVDPIYPVFQVRS